MDGVTAAGKTTLAGELAAAFMARGRPAIHLSLDGFHRPRTVRHRQGRDSARGYYQDAYDVEALAALVLEPLGPGGDRRYRTAVLDLATDTPVDDGPLTAPADAVLLVDGTFLQRPGLHALWDEVVYVETSMDVALVRAVARDAELLGGPEETERLYRTRYHAACAMYLAEADPVAHASVVLGNDDVDAPTVRFAGQTDQGLSP